MRILGIETSCDETAAAVVEATRHSPLATRLRVLSNVVASQVKLHAKTGGVVPEVAAREHVEAIIPVVQRALQEANRKSQIANRFGRRAIGDMRRAVDAIAVTVGPGLITSLRVGVETARALAYAWKKPLVAVNHLEGHIYANWLPPLATRHSPLDKKLPVTGYRLPVTQFPALVLIVSGGHTELVLMRQHLEYTIIGATRDDAAGEAFDKVAKLLGLGYPGGPAISKLAERGNPQAIDFPRPMIDSPDFDFSFAGLKTAVLYHLKNYRLPVTGYRLQNICASFEQAAVDVLVAKTIRAARKFKVKTVLLGGGVAANRRLRAQLVATIKKELPVTGYRLPVPDYTTDNAAMIAAASAFHALAKDFTPWQKIEVDPNLSL